MTDGLVSGGDTVLALKVETTPHDVTIAFVDILEAARDALGFADLRALLAEVEVIRWSSTITSNVQALALAHPAERYGLPAVASCGLRSPAHVPGVAVTSESLARDTDLAVLRDWVKPRPWARCPAGPSSPPSRVVTPGTAWMRSWARHPGPRSTRPSCR